MTQNKRLLPDIYVKDIFCIDYQKLISEGIKLFIFDIDNTLKPYGEKKPPEKVIKLFDQLRNQNVEVSLLSNGRKKRVKEFAEQLDMVALHMSLKPLPIYLTHLMKKHGVGRQDTCMIGDQIFTDVLAGKLAGIKTILVEPIEDTKKVSGKVKRWLEKKILKNIKLKEEV